MIATKNTVRKTSTKNISLKLFLLLLSFSKELFILNNLYANVKTGCYNDIKEKIRLWLNRMQNCYALVKIILKSHEQVWLKANKY